MRHLSQTEHLDVDGFTVLCVLQDPNTQRLNQQGALIAQFAVTWKSPLATAGNSSADPILHPRRWLHGYGRRQNGLCDDLAFLEEDARTAGSSHDHVARQGSGDLQSDILVGAVTDRVGHATQAALGSVHADVLPMLAVAGTKALAVLWPNSLSDKASFNPTPAVTRDITADHSGNAQNRPIPAELPSCSHIRGGHPA